MRVIGIHDINTLYFMDDVTINGKTYYAKQLADMSMPLNEEAVIEVWKVVDGAINRRIAHEAGSKL